MGVDKKREGKREGSSGPELGPESDLEWTEEAGRGLWI